MYIKNIERMLNNPFYIGTFKYNGKRYTDAQHEPLVSKEAYSLYLNQTPKEKADLMKLLTIELLFDGANVV